MDRQPEHRVRVRGDDLEWPAAPHRVTPPYPQAFLFADRLYLPWAGEPVRARAAHRCVRAGHGADDVVLALDLIDMRALAHALFAPHQHAVSPLHGGGEVRVEFDDSNRPRSVDGVDLPVVIEKDRKVMQRLLEAVVLPGTARV